MASAQALPEGKEKEELLNCKDEGDLLGIHLESRLEEEAMVGIERRIETEVEAQVAARGDQ